MQNKREKKGVAILTSEKPWLLGKRFAEQQGFECVQQAPPAFSLMVKRFKKTPPPRLIDNTKRILQNFPKGLTVFRTHQCPYIEEATSVVVDTAKRLGIHGQIVEFTSAAQVQAYSPTPYGTFGVAFNGTPIGYYYLLEKDLRAILEKTAGA